MLNSSGDISIREVAQLIGSLVAMEPGVPYVLLHYKVLEIDRNKALKLSRGNYESAIKLSSLARTDLCWWVTNIQKSSKLVEVTLNSDASKLG